VLRPRRRRLPEAALAFNPIGRGLKSRSAQFKAARGTKAGQFGVHSPRFWPNATKSSAERLSERRQAWRSARSNVKRSSHFNQPRSAQRTAIDFGDSS
jgi:hypothetical protein